MDLVTGHIADLGTAIVRFDHASGVNSGVDRVVSLDIGAVVSISGNRYVLLKCIKSCPLDKEHKGRYKTTLFES